MAGSAGSSSRSLRSAPGVRGAPSGGQAGPGADLLGALAPVRVCLTFRLGGQGAAPAGGWRGRAGLAAGSLPSRHPGPPHPALARGRREWWREPSGGGGAAPACAERGRAGGRREGHKGRRRAPGSRRPAVEEGRLPCAHEY